MTQQCDVNPFEEGTALRALRGVPSFEEALARLLHTAEHGRAFGIVRGPAGVGKSHLLECVADEFRRAGHECGHVDLRRTTEEEFAWRVACELGVAPSSDDRRRCWRQVEDNLTGRALAARLTLLLFDHLSECDAAVLDELRRLMAIVETSAGWCTVLCAARTGSQDVDAFAAGLADLRIELCPFDADETHNYLSRVVAMSGCGPFGEDAVQTVHRQTGGRLHEIGVLCRLALHAQAVEDAPEVTADIIGMVSGEVPRPPFRQLPLPRTAVMLSELGEDAVTSAR